MKIKDPSISYDLKKKELEENFIKVAEIGKYVNNEKLRDSFEKSIGFQKNMSFKEKHSLDSEEYNKVDLNEEEKEKGLFMGGSLQSYSINSFDNDELKKSNSFLNNKKNFSKNKKTVANEFLEDLEDFESKNVKHKHSTPRYSKSGDSKLVEVKMSIGQNLSEKEIMKTESYEHDSEDKSRLLIFKNEFFLIFDPSCDQSLIEDYTQKLSNLGIETYKASLLMFSAIEFIFILCFFITYNLDSTPFYYWYTLISRFFITIYPLVLFKFSQVIMMKYKKLGILLFCIFGYYFIYNYFQTSNKVAALMEFIIFLNIMLNVNNLYFLEVFVIVILFCLLFILQMMAMAFFETELWIYIIFFISNCMFLLHKIRKKHCQSIEQFNALKINLYHKSQQESLITYLLPPHIFSALTENNSQIVETLSDVTILFADIAGFTKYSSSVNALEVLSMLRELFTEFDKLCLNYKVYKLYTIGDCYVILGFLDIKNRDPTMELLKVLMVAFNMIEIITNVKKRINFNELNMRIGIHTVDIF